MTIEDLREWNRQLTRLLEDKSGEGTFVWSAMVRNHIVKLVKEWV